MPRYRIHIPLSRHEGAKTGRTYTCTAGTIYTAPEGEFKDLAAGHQYSRLDPPTTQDDPLTTDSTTQPPE